MKNRLIAYFDVIEALENYVKMAVNEQAMETRTEVVTTVLRIMDTVPTHDTMQAVEDVKALWRHALKESAYLRQELEYEINVNSQLYAAVKDTGIQFTYDDEGNITGARLPWYRRFFFRG